MKQIYITLVSLIVVIGAVFGVIAPAAISAANDIAVIFGFSLIVLSLPIIYNLSKKLYQEIKKHVS